MSKKEYAGAMASLREAGQSLQKVPTDLDKQITLWVIRHAGVSTFTQVRAPTEA